MNLQTKIALKKAPNQIDYQSQLLLCGSCFTENIADKFAYFKFPVLQNPLGILFHPVAIEKLIAKALQKKSYTADDLFFFNEQWHCFDAHSLFSNPSKENLLKQLNLGLSQTAAQIKKATHIILTFGTAWVYRKKATNAIVANCHKIPQNEFSKELLPVGEIIKSLENSMQEIQRANKNVQLILTLSPVRHLKDGFIENQRSKAHLNAAIHQLIQSSNSKLPISYFPSYEIVMDELRDYRFYKPDMIHPNQIAIDYIWKKFKMTWIAAPVFELMNTIEDVQKALAHRPLNANTSQHQKFLKSLDDKIAYLQQAHSFMTFDK